MTITITTWGQVRAGDILQAHQGADEITVEWVAHDYDISDPGHLLVLFKGTRGVGLISANHSVTKTGHDFEVGARQTHPFPSIELALEDTPLAQTYRLWLAAEDKWQAVAKYIGTLAKYIGTHDIQWFYETVLTDEERAAWDLFVSGGKATAEQWAEVKANSAFNSTPTPAPANHLNA